MPQTEQKHTVKAGEKSREEQLRELLLERPRSRLYRDRILFEQPRQRRRFLRHP